MKKVFILITTLAIAGFCNAQFEKGQILKYNMNLDRIDNTQTNLTFYIPILPQIKK